MTMLMMMMMMMLKGAKSILHVVYDARGIEC